VLSYLGTKMILIEGNLIGDLLAPDRRRELKFLLARYVGAFKARHMRLEIVALVISAIHQVKFLNLFLNPYYRATSYSGDQIGLACSGDLRTALRATARLMCGKDVEPAVAAAGVIDQAAIVSHRVLPRLAQVFAPEPHLTNRYLNLVMFAKARHPSDWRSFMDELDERTAAGLETLSLRSPHVVSTGRRPDDGAALFVDEWESDANVIGSAVLAIVAAGLFAWSRFATPGDLKLFGTALLIVDGILVGGLILAALATLVRRSPSLVALTAMLAAGLAGWTGLVPALEIAVNDFIESSLSGWLDQATALLAGVAALGLTASRGRLAVLMERRPTLTSRTLELVAVTGAVAVIVATFLPTYGFDGDKVTYWEASPGAYDVVRVVVAAAVICAALAAAGLRGRLLAWFGLLASCTSFFVVFTPFDFNEAYSLEVGWWVALGGASLAFAAALSAWLMARPNRSA
jgi:hypothetical protein